jgi:hypothetical protein
MHAAPRLRCHSWLFATGSQDGGIAADSDLERILKLCAGNGRSEAQLPGRCSQETLGKPARSEHADATSFDCGSGSRGFDPRHSPQLPSSFLSVVSGPFGFSVLVFLAARKQTIVKES